MLLILYKRETMSLMYIGMFHLIFPFITSIMLSFMKWLFKNDLTVKQKLIYKVQLTVAIMLITLCIVALILKSEGSI